MTDARSQLHPLAFPSQWAERHAIIRDEAGRKRPYSFTGRAFLRDLFDDLSPHCVAMKGPQVGLSMLAILRTLWWLDVSNRDILYVMPTIQDVSDFSAGRFAYMLKASQAVRDLFTEVDNVRHKRAKSGANLYFRGARGETSLISIPVAGLIIDEYDRIGASAVEDARDRLTGSTDTWEIDVSTPTLPDAGIDREYRLSDRRTWRVPCPRCRKARPMAWPDSLAGDLLGDPDAVAWRCVACGEPWRLEEKYQAVQAGTWVAEEPSSSIRGWKIPQLLSPVLAPSHHARRWAEAQGSPERLAAFYASMAEPYVPEGSRFDEAMFHDARLAGDRDAPARPDRLSGVVGGVDAGVNRHYVVVLHVLGERARLLEARVARDYHEAEAILRRWRCQVVVLDAQPNTERARELQSRMNGERGELAVWLAFYGGREMKIPMRWHDEEGTVTARRTEVIDSLYSRWATRRVSIPRDLPPEFQAHFLAMSRVVETDENKGNAEARWVSSGPDHFAHASTYAELAATRLVDADALLPGEEWPADPPFSRSEDPIGTSWA